MTSYLILIRPFNCFFAALTILFGASYKNLFFTIDTSSWLAVVSACLIAAGGYAINDYYDLEIDKINKPKRVLPSGKITPKVALIFSLTLFAAGIGFSFYIKNKLCFPLAISNSVLLFLYAKYLKKRFFFGNLLVAYASASTFIYGALSSNNLKNAIIPAIFAFLFTFAREIVKDEEDIVGDLKHGASSLPIKFGKKASHFAILGLSLALILCVQFSRIFHAISGLSFIFLNLFISIPLLVMNAILQKNAKTKTCKKISSAMKLDMFCLLTILWFLK